MLLFPYGWGIRHLLEEASQNREGQVNKEAGWLAGEMSLELFATRLSCLKSSASRQTEAGNGREGINCGASGSGADRSGSELQLRQLFAVTLTPFLPKPWFPHL